MASSTLRNWSLTSTLTGLPTLWTKSHPVEMEDATNLSNWRLGGYLVGQCNSSPQINCMRGGSLFQNDTKDKMFDWIHLGPFQPSKATIMMINTFSTIVLMLLTWEAILVQHPYPASAWFAPTSVRREKKRTTSFFAVFCIAYSRC